MSIRLERHTKAEDNALLCRSLHLDESRPPRLGNTQIKSTPSKYRKERLELREGLREITTLKRLKACGKVPVAPLVTLRGEQGGTAGYGGLSTCSSVWSCPSCSAVIAHRRQESLADLIRWAEKEGYRVSLVTYTQSHHAGQGLEMLWESLKSGFKSVVSGGRYQQFKEQTGFLGFVKACEVTHGSSSWHAHYHVLCISRENLETKMLQFKNGEIMSCEDFLFSRWQKGLEKAGMTCSREHGIDLRTAEVGDAETLGRYVAKMGTAGMGENGLSKELTLSAFKQAKNGNRTPFQIAKDAVAGDEESKRLWWEFERVSKGRRALIYSAGLKDIDPRTDEEICEEEEQEQGDVVLTLDHENWRKVRQHGAVELLEALEKGGIYTARAWCDAREIVWKPPEVGKYREPKRE